MMKIKFALIAVACSFIFFYPTDNFALDKSVSTTASVTIGGAFTASFKEPDGTHIMYSGTVPFTNIDPTKSYALPDQRSADDNKSDIGIVCVSADGKPWSLQIGINGGNLPDNSLKYYVSQPYIWTGSDSIQTNGTVIPDPPAWTPIPTGTSTAIYKSGTNDSNNTPFGTLITISFQLDPTGLKSGAYTATVVYTMSSLP